MLIQINGLIIALLVVTAPALANAPSMRTLPQPPAMMAISAQQQSNQPPGLDDLITSAVEYNGWIYQTVSGGTQQTFNGNDERRETIIYSGFGFPATITICSYAAPVIIRVRILGRLQGETSSRNGVCSTVTGDDIGLATTGGDSNFRLRVRYRILAIHPPG
jgi:hypothetical protein